MKTGVPTADDEILAAALIMAASPRSACGCNRAQLSLLREDAEVYRGRGAIETERLRAHLMVRLAGAGHADDLLPYVLEELETGKDPIAIAAAARAARRVRNLPEEIVTLLTGAIERIRDVDEIVDFDRYPPAPRSGGTTAVAEAIATLGVAGPKGRAVVDALSRHGEGGFSGRAVEAMEAARGRSASDYACCSGHEAKGPPNSRPETESRTIAPLRDVELQNQDGVRGSFGRFFAGRAALVAFFYTRCTNPNKCSLTIGKLAQVDALLGRCAERSGAIVAGITYDPQFDTLERLLRYGSERGLVFHDGCQLLRSTLVFDPIRDALQLGVGYSASTVNRHRLELLFIDPQEAIVDCKVRRLWDPREVADTVRAIARSNL